ncbi:DUF397 domain-containing protein [Streptomyces sp. P9(2023)]|uniref:DUF397 domain-containing protein n=1 Tax=Streptomyces sp. P9(2023) TaxID=3064394 RepID=UPI0028F45893|nr:DUF397 domain-containing protein [Streptomyces sp. P9(2023)]MDT9690765.1 DUF397 domain-containing protein [Streptomyces sp. P9(2023)]
MERFLAVRMARKTVFERDPALELGFVLEVEVAAAPDSVPVRDSKNLGGPQSALPRWAGFVSYASGI